MTSARKAEPSAILPLAPHAWGFGRATLFSFGSTISIGGKGTILCFRKGTPPNRVANDPRGWRCAGGYIKDHRPQADTDAVFVRSSAPYRAFADSTAISILAARAMRRTGINCPKRGVAHILRHSVASAMLRARSAPAGDRRCAPPPFDRDHGDLRQSGCGHSAADRAAMAGGGDMLSQDVQAYLAVRRAMGFAMKWSGNLLRGFAALSEAAGQHHVCSDTAIK